MNRFQRKYINSLVKNAKRKGKEIDIDELTIAVESNQCDKLVISDFNGIRKKQLQPNRGLMIK